jgi:hypothetical protein
MSDLRVRLVVDAPLTEEAAGLLTAIVAKEMAEEVRAVFQNLMVQKGMSSRYESEASVALVHLHTASPCGTCREHTLDNLTNY